MLALLYIQKMNVSVLACNTQIYNQISASTIFKNKPLFNKIFPVPDQSIFKYKNKKAARGDLKIDDDKVVFFFGAVSVNEKRKGTSILLAALNELKLKFTSRGVSHENLIILIAGGETESIKTDITFPVYDLGFVKNYEILASAYQACDYFICPSIEETGPTMVLQSLMCETPVIGFELGYLDDLYIGVLRDLIPNTKDSAGLSEVIYKAFLEKKAKWENYHEEILKIKPELTFDRFQEKLQFVLNQ